jgi:hypothetical protein
VKADADDNTDYRVVSVDVVLSFDKDDDFEIPDSGLGKWIATNPQSHATKATAAHAAYSSEWKRWVRRRRDAGRGQIRHILCSLYAAIDA